MKDKKKYYVYITSSGKNGTIYIGVTGNLIRRIRQHKNKEIEGFTKKYNVDILVHYEIFGEVGMALYREKQLKGWKRAWKIALIEEANPGWKDLVDELYDH